MSGHTPGPWFVAVGQSGMIGVVDRKPSPSHDDPVHDADTHLVAIPEDARGCDAMDNARLIAAAPELLAACIDLLQHASVTEHMSASSVERARAAVEKAGAA